MLIERLPDQDGIVIAMLSAPRLDGQCADGFRREISALLERSKGMVLDLQQTTYVDSIGLGALLYATRQAARQGSALVVCGLQPNIRALLGLVRMDRVIATASDRAEAVAQLSRGLGR